MKRVTLGAVLILGCLATSLAVYAGQSQVPFPKDWRSWTPVETPLTQIGALPGCDADVSGLPPIYQETVAIYCPLRQGGPGKVAILVRPSEVETFKARNGKFSDGVNMILHLVDMKVLMVSGHEKGQVKYGLYTEDGKDIAADSGPLAMETCITCHSGYEAFCVNGQCGRAVNK